MFVTKHICVMILDFNEGGGDMLTICKFIKLYFFNFFVFLLFKVFLYE